MSSTAPTTVGTTRGIRVGRALVVIGGAVVALSSWLNWGAKSPLGAARTAYTIPAKFVIDKAAEPGSGGLSLGVVLVVLGVLVIAVTFTPAWRIAGLVLGLAVAVTAILYVYQVREIVHGVAPNSPIAGKSVRDFISIGPYLAAIGGLVAAAGAVIALIPPGFWSSLTSEETSEEDEGKPAGAGGAP